MTDHWVTIEGRHVLIKDRALTGGGHEGVHDPATETGNVQVDAILKSRLLPAVETPSGRDVIGVRGQRHWQIMEKSHLQPPGKTESDMLALGYKRGYVDPVTRKFFDAKRIGIDSTELV